MNEFSERRDKIAEKLENGNAIIILGEDEPKGIAQFIQNNHLLYLAGLEIPKVKLIMYKINDKVNTVVFIEKNIPERIVWEGEKMRPAECTEVSGIETVKFTFDFEDFLSTILPFIHKIFLNFAYNKIGDPITKELLLIQKIKTYYPNMQFKQFVKLVESLRLVKSEWEIEQLQKAIDATEDGIRNIMNQGKTGMIEYQLEAILQHAMLDKGLRNYGFTPIVAGGVNATTLHYITNDTEINENELVLLDVGAACNNYSADISRTFPIAEKFSPRQKEVYGKVLDIQKEIISMVKPGIGMKELNEKTVELMKIALKELNLIEKDEEYKKYYMHSVGHFLGMDTHDLGGREAKLEVGHVITVEPGIYIKDEKIGVRIEDDILVTEEGFRVLSINIPKEIADLELIRKNALNK